MLVEGIRSVAKTETKKNLPVLALAILFSLT
jgi:hypothetical protein